MKPEVFQKEEYRTLREEIRESKARIFQIIVYGGLLIPSAQSLAQSLEWRYAITYLPFLVPILALLYLAESHAMMRCGLYIKDHLEKGMPENIGWETWLESRHPSAPRRVDRYMSIAFYMLFALYYVGSCFAAVRYLSDAVTIATLVVMCALYVATGLVTLILLLRGFEGSVTTEHRARRGAPAPPS